MVYVSRVGCLLVFVTIAMTITDTVYAIEDGTYYCKSTTLVSINGNEVHRYDDVTFPLVIRSSEGKIMIPEGSLRDSWSLSFDTFSNNTIYADDANMAGKWLFLRQRDNKIDMSISMLTFSNKKGINHTVTVANATCQNW